MCGNASAACAALSVKCPLQRSDGCESRRHAVFCLGCRYDGARASIDAIVIRTKFCFLRAAPVTIDAALRTKCMQLRFGFLTVRDGPAS